jgi:hypothetical protein
MLVGSGGKLEGGGRAKGELEGFRSMGARPEEEGGSDGLGKCEMQLALVLVISLLERG